MGDGVCFGRDLHGKVSLPQTTESSQRFREVFYGAWSSFSLLSEGPYIAKVAALFRPAIADLAGMATGIGSGVGGVFCLIEAGYTAREFRKDRAAYKENCETLERTNKRRARTAIGIKQWTADIAGGFNDSIDTGPQNAGRVTRTLGKDLSAALMAERASLDSSRLKKAHDAGFLSFLRDSLFQSAGAGSMFAGCAKTLFHGAHVKLAVLPIVGAGIGIACGAGHIAAGIHARREAEAIQKHAQAVIDRTQEDWKLVAACGTDARKLATLLTMTGANSGEPAFGKEALQVAEAGLAPEADTASRELIAQARQAAGEGDVGMPEVPVRSGAKTQEERIEDYARHASNATPDSLARGTNLIGRLVGRIQVNEEAAIVKATYDRAVGAKRIVYGAWGVVSNLLALILQLTGAGTLLGMLIVLLTPIGQKAAAAVWCAYASYRSRRSGEQPLSVEAEKDGTLDGAEIPSLSTASSDEMLIDEVMTLLQEDKAESTLARKALKATLREHGVSRLALQLMKFGRLFGGKMSKRDFSKKATELVREQIRNLITGDGARTAAAERRAVDLAQAHTPVPDESGGIVRSALIA